MFGSDVVAHICLFVPAYYPLSLYLKDYHNYILVRRDVDDVG